MSRIIAAVRPTTAQKRAATERAIAATETELSELRTALVAALVDDDEGVEAAKLSNRIAAAEQRLSLQRARLAALAKQNRRETTDHQQQQKAEALAAFEKNFADERVAAAARIVQATRELSAALQAHARACRQPFTAWPHHLFPPVKLFDGAAYSYVPSVIASALRMQNPGAAPGLLADLPARIGDLAERDIKLCASMIEDIRTAELPRLPDASEAA